MSADAPRLAPLQQLVKYWPSVAAQEPDSSRATAYDGCADELEAALAALAPSERPEVGPVEERGIGKMRRVLILRAEKAEQLLTRYLDNHCANADAEGMSTFCECKLCLDTRKALNMPIPEPAAPSGRQETAGNHESRSPDGDGPVSSCMPADRTSEPRSAGAGSEPADSHPSASVEGGGMFDPPLDSRALGDEALRRPRHCPRCDSPQPHLHPSVQWEGEVQPCSDPWHGAALAPSWGSLPVSQQEEMRGRATTLLTGAGWSKAVTDVARDVYILLAAPSGRPEIEPPTFRITPDVCPHCGKPTGGDVIGPATYTADYLPAAPSGRPPAKDTP